MMALATCTSPAARALNFLMLLPVRALYVSMRSDALGVDAEMVDFQPFGDARAGRHFVRLAVGVLLANLVAAAHCVPGVAAVVEVALPLETARGFVDVDVGGEALGEIRVHFKFLSGGRRNSPPMKEF